MGAYNITLEKGEGLIQLMEEKFGEGHMELAKIYSIIARVHRNLGDFEQGLIFYKKSLD